MIIPLLLGIGSLVGIALAVRSAEENQTTDENLEKIDEAVGEVVDEEDPDPGTVLEGSEAAEEEGAVETASALRIAAIIAKLKKTAPVKGQILRVLLTPYYRARIAPDKREMRELMLDIPDHAQKHAGGLLAAMIERPAPWLLSEIVSLGSVLGFGWPDPVSSGDLTNAELADDEVVGDWLDEEEGAAKHWAMAQGYLVMTTDGKIQTPSDQLEDGDPFEDDEGDFDDFGDDVTGGAEQLEEELEDLLNELE